MSLRIFLWIFVVITLITGFFLYTEMGYKIVAQETLCNGLLSVQATRVNQGFERGIVNVFNIFYVKNNKKKLVGSITKRTWDAFHPLPRNTAIPYYFIRAQDMEYSDGPYAGVDNLFVDPNTFTRSEFGEIGDCIQKEATSVSKIEQSLSTSGLGSIPYLGGFIYDTYDHYMQIVQALNTDPVFMLDGGALPTFQINPWGTIFYRGDYGGDIFGGLAHDPEYYGDYFLKAKNRSGKRINEYLKQISESLVRFNAQ